MIYQVQMYLKNKKPLHQVEKLIPDMPSDNKQEIVETTPVNTEIASVNIKDDKTVIKKECDKTVNQAPVINFPVFNTDSSQQSLAIDAYYQCINMYKGGHLFYPRLLQVVFVF
jgi:hypothetical protein